MRESRRGGYDTIVVGSGFGGTLTALELVRAGQRVLMLERGGWDGPGAGAADEVWDFFQHRGSYVPRSYRVQGGGRQGWEGMCACVGGSSVFYGGVSLRLRREDFEPQPELTGSSAAWPVDYAAMEPYYSRAERLLDVSGEAGGDPTEPERSAPYPRPPAPLAPISERVAEAARRRGLHPFRLPLALDDSVTRTTACDGYPAAGLGRIVRGALEPAEGFELRTGAVVTRLHAEGGRVVAVEYVDAGSGTRRSERAERVVLAAGALASPHLLLASGLDALNPGGRTVGRYLMRHCNAFVYGVFARLPEPGRFHKQVAVNDFYWVAGEDGGRRKLGNLQQVMHPQVGGILGVPARLLRHAGGVGRVVIGAAAGVARRFAHHLSGLQVIAEDEPRATNRVELDRSATDRWGLPGVRVHHQYTPRDLAAREELVRQARAILREAGALGCITYHVQTFSHAVGTVRMGSEPERSALDEHCRFRGLDNLYVVDGSFMPTSGAVNPSLTIAANALRVGEHLARGV